MNETSNVFKRNSLLKRNPKLSHEQFSQHYEHHHGPLAASQAGFRQYATQYVQNHVEPLPDGAEPRFDGVTMSTQVPREDYNVGFFKHPDYENVKDDEQYLFDIPQTVSVLGKEIVEVDLPKSRFKAIVLTSASNPNGYNFGGLTRVVTNNLNVSTASALGFHAGTFEYDRLLELWFESASQRDDAYRDFVGREERGPKEIFLPIREVLIYGPEKPWQPENSTPPGEANARREKPFIW